MPHQSLPNMADTQSTDGQWHDPSQLRRRQLLAGAAGLGVGSAFGVRTHTGTAAATTGSRDAHERPNIVVISVDDLGFSDVGCFGSDLAAGGVATPNIDSIATAGRRYTQMYTNARCTPTRASLLTGLYPTQAGCGLLTRDLGWPEYQGYLNDQCVTLADVLKGAGYSTSISGKWHLAPWNCEGSPTPQSLPHTRGFDRSWCGIGAGGGGYYNPCRYYNGEFIGKPDRPGFYMIDAITRHAAESIRTFAADGGPFFSFVSYSGAHFPLQAPEEAIAPHRGKFRDLGWDVLRAARYERQRELGVIDPAWALPEPDPVAPSWETSDHDWEDLRMAVYAAQISLLDIGVGRLLRNLEAAGVADNTLVIFLSDNGATTEIRPGNGEGDTPRQDPGPPGTDVSIGLGWAGVSNAPFRKHKKWVHEGGIATPCAMRWPGVIEPGSIEHRPVHVIDFMPTVVELAQTDYPAEHEGRPVTPMQGRSMVPTMTGAPQPGRRLFWEHVGNAAVRQGRWKVVREHLRGAADPLPWELYDMAADRTETTNLAAERPGLISDLTTAWEGWKNRVRVADWDGTRYVRP